MTEPESIARFASQSPYEDLIGYSRVVRAGAMFATAGCTATVDGVLIGVGDAAAQARAAFGVAIKALEQAGCPRESVTSSRIYLLDRADAAAVGAVHAQLLGDVKPVATLLVVAGFLDERMLVEVELTGYLKP